MRVLVVPDTHLRGILPDKVELDLDGLPVAMLHDFGVRAGREARRRRRFPDAALVAFGHSHQSHDDIGTQGQRLFNPGSCTERRRAPSRTYGWLEIDGGCLRDHRIIEISDPSPRATDEAVRTTVTAKETP